MKNKTQTITFWTVCIFLVAYFVHFANFPNELTMLLGGALCLGLVIGQKKFRIDAGICFLAVTLISYYVIINGKSGLFYSILYIPLVIYELGNYMAAAEKKEQRWMLLLILLIAGYTVHGMLNSYMYYAGYVVPGTRRWQDFWSGEIVPGTQHAAYFLPMFALFLPAVLFWKKRIWMSGITVLCTAFFGYTSLVTKSRMSVMIFAIIVCIQMLLFMTFEWNQIKKLLKNKKFWIATFVLVTGIVTAGLLVRDSKVVTAFLSNLGKGGGIITNVRFQAQKKALIQLFEHPMGGGMMEFGGISHAHNVWLDMANAAGLIPFFAFTAYTAYTMYELIQLLKKNEVSTEIKLIFAGLYGAFFLYFTVEPALEASIHLITPWIYVNGLLHGYLMIIKSEKKAE